MTTADLQWLVGLSVTVVLTIAGIAFGAFRAVSNRLDKLGDAVRAAMKEGDDALHERVNRLRQDVSDNYVRRIDLDSHMQRVDATLKEVRDDQKQMIKTLASLEGKVGT